MGVDACDCPFEVGQKADLQRGIVNYRLEGPSGAPLVVCLHGLNASLASFTGLSAALQEKGLRMLTFDFYGFGLSAIPRGRFETSLYVEQLEALLTFLEEPSVHIVGFCLGGLVAAEFALQHPSRVQKLLLIAPAGMGPRSEAPCGTFLFGCLRRRIRGSLLLAVARCLTWSCARPTRYYLRGKQLGMCTPDVRKPNSAEALAAAQKIADRFVWSWPQSATSFLRGLRDMPLWREDFEDSIRKLAASQVPVLFLWGTEDNVMPYDEAQDLVEELFGPRGSSCILISGAGHGILSEKQDVPQVAHCACSWFVDSQDPNWRDYIAGFTLHTAGAEPSAPELVGALAV